MIKNINDINISVAIAIFNEEKKIIDLLDSLYDQTIKPYEIIISDGGSTDKTLSLIKKYINQKQSFAIKIKILGRKGKCRGAGRNTAIHHCKKEHIALIDSGHIADKKWIEGFASIIIKNPNVKYIHGCVKPNTNSYFNKLLSCFILGNKKHSGKMVYTVASLLITKKLWEQIGKFKESTNGSYVVEDLNFLKKIKKINTPKHISKLSITDWNLVENLKELFIKYEDYSEGAINNGYFGIWHKGVLRNYLIYTFIIVLSFFVSTVFILFLIILLFLRSYFYLNKNNWYLQTKLINKIKYLIGFTFILTIIDLSAIKGIFNWIYKKIF